MNLVLPRVEREASSQNYCQFVIGPLESGYGITLGNALRRVLLSSLTGAAVTSMRLTDVSHEFSAIPHVKEDTTWLILNVKQLRFRMDDDVEDSVTARIEVRGEGPVLAGDIICPPGVEIVNPEIRLLTADSSETDLDIELTVERGRGYLSTEDRDSSQLALGELPVDAIFSPIRRVRYDVERARLGPQGGYDKLILHIWTDGTISPEEGLQQAAQLLVQHLVLIGGVEAVALEVAAEEEAGIPSGLYEQEIDALGLNVRVYNCLRRAGITTVGEVLENLKKGDDALLSIRNFGEKSLDELKERLLELELIPEEGAEFGEPEQAPEEEALLEEPGEAAEPEPVVQQQPEEEPAKEPEAAVEDLGEEEEEEAEEEEVEPEEVGPDGLRFDDQFAEALRKAMMRGREQD